MKGKLFPYAFVFCPYSFSTATSLQMPALSSFVLLRSPDWQGQPPCSSSSVGAAAFSLLQSQHPKSQHLHLVTTIYTRACIIINKLGARLELTYVPALDITRQLIHLPRKF